MYSRSIYLYAYHFININLSYSTLVRYCCVRVQLVRSGFALESTYSKDSRILAKQIMLPTCGRWLASYASLHLFSALVLVLVFGCYLSSWSRCLAIVEPSKLE